MDPLIVAKFIGQSGLGLFTVSSNISALPTSETTRLLNTTLFPGFIHVRHDSARLRRAYTRVQSLISAIAIPCGFGMAVLADPLIRLALGEKWLAAIPIVQVLSITYAIKTLGTTADSLAMATGQTRMLFHRNLQALALRLPIILVGLYLGALEGLLVALVITTILGIMLDMMVVKQICGLTHIRQILDNGRALSSGIIMAGLTLFVVGFLPFGNETASSLARIFIGSLVGLAIYSASMFLGWVIAGQPNGPEREIMEIAASVRRRFAAILFAP